jgi:hypothetical protein
MMDKQKVQSKSQSNAVLNSLYTEYGLTSADVFKHKHFNIITRSGMEKIMDQSGVTADYECIFASETCVIIKGTFTLLIGDKVTSLQTFASASDQTSTSAYYAEMAEKRCMARGVLKLLGFYTAGFYSEDEFGQFDDEKEAEAFKYAKKSRFSSPRATVQGQKIIQVK